MRAISMLDSGQHIVAFNHGHLQAWQTELARDVDDFVPGSQRIGCAHVGDDADTFGNAGRQHGLHAVAQQGIKPQLCVLAALELRQCNGSFGQAFKHQIVELAFFSQLDGGGYAVAGVAGAGAYADGFHVGFQGLDFLATLQE